MKVLERTLAVLEELAVQPSGLGVRELSDRLAEAPATIHRVLAVLVGRNFLSQDSETKRYRLGPAALRIGHAYQEQNTLIRIARPILNQLTAQTLESSFVTEMIGTDAICIVTADSPRQLRFFMRPGQRMPFHAAASARAILAFQPEVVAQELLGREAIEPFTAFTPGTVLQVTKELVRVRQQGYAVCDEEMEIGVTAVSVPIRNASEGVMGSVTIVGPHHRLNDYRDQTVELLKGSAAMISQGLGLSPSRVAAIYGAASQAESGGLRFADEMASGG
jgi:DNA-binding IclR family transcriptional regulator